MRLIGRVPTRHSCVGWYFCVLVVLLSSLQFSVATYNPAYHPQQPQRLQQGTPSSYPVQGDQSHHEPPRGGSTMVASPPSNQYDYEEVKEEQMQQHAEEQPFEPPTIDLKHMSMALRLTSEWNRRLQQGVSRFKRVWGMPNLKPQPENKDAQPPENYGDHPVNINPSRAWHPPIPEGPLEEEEKLSLFHAKTPRDPSNSNNKERRGVARWGPELLPYLEHIVDLLGITNGVEVPLAMIYLDRACSVETLRNSGVPPCPFCTPRTAHRLSLAALILAKQTVDGTDNVDMYYDSLKSLGIPLVQLQQMVDWMRAALGDGGQMVTIEQMKGWSQTWHSIFYPKQRQRQLNPPRQANALPPKTDDASGGLPD